MLSSQLLLGVLNLMSTPFSLSTASSASETPRSPPPVVVNSVAVGERAGDRVGAVVDDDRLDVALVDLRHELGVGDLLAGLVGPQAGQQQGQGDGAEQQPDRPARPAAGPAQAAVAAATAAARRRGRALVARRSLLSASARPAAAGEAAGAGCSWLNARGQVVGASPGLRARRCELGKSRRPTEIHRSASAVSYRDPPCRGSTASAPVRTARSRPSSRSPTSTAGRRCGSTTCSPSATRTPTTCATATPPGCRCPTAGGSTTAGRPAGRR